jgi:transcriptional regulator with XRE-family HTH domain
MSQTDALVQTLKRALKAKGFTYADVAARMDLSENSIKRLFATRSFSIERLEQICELVDMEISDLVQSMLENSRRIEMLTDEQEREVAGDIKLLLVATCVLDRWTAQDILITYKLTEHECIKLLAKLDKLKIIELLPKNRVKVIVAKNFKWRPSGPIQQFFRSTVQSNFFDSEFQQPGEKLLFSSGMLSRGSNVLMMKKLERLSAEFNELHDADIGLPLNERFGTSMVVALRAWEFGAFRKLRRQPGSKPFTEN